MRPTGASQKVIDCVKINLRILINEKKLTLRLAAKEIGLSVKQVENIFYGDPPSITYETLSKIKIWARKQKVKF